MEMEVSLDLVIKTIFIAIFYYSTLCSCIYIVVLLKKNSFFVFCNDAVVPNKSNTRIVLITAHPDDECMFFSPTLVNLTSSCRESSFFVICITTGDYYKKGALRRNELLKSCQLLGILRENVTILDDSSFPDDPKSDWDLDELCKVLLENLSRIQANIIFTFDDRGVSGHPNHIAVSNVVRKLIKNQSVAKVYELETVSIFRKYIGLLDLPLTLMCNQLTFISSPRNILRAQKAMFAHKSQLEWFRLLYILFSRYMIMNTYAQV